MCEKFHYDRLRNDRALENGKSDNYKNPKNKKNVALLSNVVNTSDILLLTAVFCYAFCVFFTARLVSRPETR